MMPDRSHLQAPSPLQPHGAEITRPRKKIILCFDGTGNKFKGNDGDTNILKIFRMLDRSGNEQCKTSFPRPGRLRLSVVTVALPLLFFFFLSFLYLSV